jgi:hypothetical protein
MLSQISLDTRVAAAARPRALRMNSQHDRVECVPVDDLLDHPEVTGAEHGVLEAGDGPTEIDAVGVVLAERADA